MNQGQICMDLGHFFARLSIIMQKKNHFIQNQKGFQMIQECGAKNY